MREQLGAYTDSCLNEEESGVSSDACCNPAVAGLPNPTTGTSSFCRSTPDGVPPYLILFAETRLLSLVLDTPLSRGVLSSRAVTSRLSLDFEFHAA